TLQTLAAPSPSPEPSSVAFVVVGRFAAAPPRIDGGREVVGSARREAVGRRDRHGQARGSRTERRHGRTDMGCIQACSGWVRDEQDADHADDRRRSRVRRRPHRGPSLRRASRRVRAELRHCQLQQNMKLLVGCEEAECDFAAQDLLAS
uniref:Uncharacterized protein n=1 Tax=Triticum urartu TaxID=4572 RepID=A0A8R7QFK9_TRIUA